MMPSTPKTPLWMTVLIIVVMLPVCQMPVYLSTLPADTVANIRTLLWLYPAYVLLSGYLAWQCWPQRPAVSWILIILMALSHLAMFMMVKSVAA